MKYFILIFTCLASLPLLAAFPKVDQVRSTISKKQMQALRAGKISQSYSVLDWNLWRKKPGTSLLLPTPGYQPPIVTEEIDGEQIKTQEKLVIYHSRSAFIVNKPTATFQAKHFYNIHFPATLSPSISRSIGFSLPIIGKVEAKLYELGSTHQPIGHGLNGAPCPTFCFRSQTYFPPTWRAAMSTARQSGLLGSHNVGYLQVDSEMSFTNQIQPAIQNQAQRLTKTNFPLATIVSQNAVAYQSNKVTHGINQMIQFASSFIRIYDIGNNQSLVILDTAMGIEKDIDAKVNNNSMARNLLKGIFRRSPKTFISKVLIGKDRGVNTKYGIGAGLPQYTKALTKNLKKTMSQMN